MSISPEELNRHDAFSLGLVRTIQALTAVVYRDAPERDKLEQQLRIYLGGESTAMSGDLLATYKLPIEGALKVIAEIKAAQK